MEPLSQGKVWLGVEAVENGLADELGSLPKALLKAAELAEVDDWSPLYMKKPVDPRDAFLAELLKTAQLQTIVPGYIRQAMSFTDLDMVMNQIQQGNKLQALCEPCLSGLR